MEGYFVERSDQLEHHGILGQKWGVRRYQNSDGSLTDRGKRRYGIGNDRGLSERPGSRSNTNKSGTSPTSPFSEANNIKVVNKILKDTDNCSFCAFAMDLRKRGIDVRAGGSKRTSDGATCSEIASWYKGDNSFTDNNYFYDNVTDHGCRISDDFNKTKADKMFKWQLMEGGEGSSGHAVFQNVVNKEYADEAGLKTQFLGGHDVFYQVENGEVYIIDAQSGEKVTFDEYVNTNNSIEDGYSIMMYPTNFLRTDDLEPNVILNEDGKLVLAPENPNNFLDQVAVPYQSPTSNYSPPTRSIKTKPANYSPPYKSKSEMELFVEDCANFVKKEAAWERKVISKVGEGIENFVNTLDSLFWRLY